MNVHGKSSPGDDATTSLLRWGIAGPGSIARRFATQLLETGAGTLAAVASRSPERARAFIDEVADGDGDVGIHGSYDDLFADGGVDAVYISTVHTGHVRLAVRALEAGKHVICEKPLAVTHAGAMQVVEAARRSGSYLAEGYMYRFHPQTAALLDLLRSGTIGEVLHVEASFAFAMPLEPGHRLFDAELAGGGILDVGGYPLSMARLIAGVAVGAPFAEPVSITGGGTVGSTGVDEWASASLVFASGVTADVRCGIRIADENRVIVTGSAGRIVVDDPWIPSGPDGSQIEVHVVGEKPRTVHVPLAFSHALQATAVGRDLAAGQSAEMSPADSLGNAAALDRWRGAVGVRYPFEADDAGVPTASGRPLRVRVDGDGPAMPYGSIVGIEKRISRLVIGCDNQRTITHAAAIFDDFFERGGNAFDTGWLYGGGLMERLLGRWIAERGIREDVVVIGKGAHTPFCDPESLTRQLFETLDRLGTDHVDLYLMHRDNLEVPVGEFVDVLDEHSRAGRITAFGGSNWTIPRFTEANAYAAANGRQGFAALSDHFGLARALDVPWEGCVQVTAPEDREWLEQTGTALLPWSSQARGFFARADRDDLSDAELVRCYYADDNFERLARARELAERMGVAPTAIALAYVLAQRFPTFALIGPRTIDETRTSLAGLGVELTASDVAWLDLR